MVDLVLLLKTVGYFGLFGIIFSESGLLIGVFLPGDSLVFTAGVLASQKYLDLQITLTVIVLGALLGDSFAYFLGRRFGPAIFRKEESLLFRKSHLERAQAFYRTYGKKTILFARFVPVVRTFAALLAGVGRMNYRLFLLFDCAGVILWGIGLPLLGYYLGESIENIDRYLLPLIGLIILLSLTPTIIHLIRHKADRQALFRFFKNLTK